MLRAVKIRLYPNVEQAETINRLLGCSRYVYNALLDLKTKVYNENGNSLSLLDLSRHYHAVMRKDPDTPWLKDANTKVIKQTIRHLFTAYDNFFKHKAKFPKFKSKKDVNRITFPLEAISKSNTFNTRHISLTQPLRNLRFRCSDLSFRRLRENKDRIRSATLTKTKSGKYELSVLVDFEDPCEFRKFGRTGRAVGVDLGVKDFAVTSEGEVFENIHPFKSTEKRIRKLSKDLSRKKKGSSNREKARRKLANAYERVTMRREARLHGIVNALLSKNDVVVIENLNVSGMMKNRHLAKAIGELGLWRFGQILKDKASLNGKTVVEVDRWFPSSKTCHECGHVYKGLTLSERQWRCPACGKVHDRDRNAALNILKEGKRIIGCRTPELKPVGESSCGRPFEKSNLRSSGPMKQEKEIDSFV